MTRGQLAELQPEQLEEMAEVAARFFRGLGDPTRYQLLVHLLDGPKTVSELIALVGVPQARVSNHLACLRWCGYATSRREGRNVYYQVSDPRVRELLQLAQAIMAEHASQLLACVRIG
jgi:DNA-binding transcriptional ArsR family regulator